ncbi:Dyp-type peroxidase [Microlunatus soli]|uniref:Dyp-type peroxidase n=1 Tax=Microlunatus soli TaxID=630515 RepID=UPI001E43EFE2|nr:Dyp-type peroxidase [Microlunatus soli]
MAGTGLSARVGRRGLMLGGAGVGAALLAAGGHGDARADGQPSPRPRFGPYGEHQGALINEPTAATAVISCDVITDRRAELAELFMIISDRIGVLTGGAPTASDDPSRPPDDNGILGPSYPGGKLGVVVGVGASLFDDRFGLADRKPVGLTSMRTFPNDDLDERLTHGDLSIQLTSADDDVVTHAVRDLTKHTRGLMQPRWRINGTAAAPRPAGAPRNLLGFKDGTANPATDPATLDRLIWVGTGQPSWAAGGTFQVIRIIRNLVEFWDRVSLQEQELMFGRRRDSGAPLDGDRETEAPDFAADPRGQVIPLDAHIRLANPRTEHTDRSRILRRSWNYDLGLDSNGQLNQGTLFSCYQQDLQRQFEAVQTRLIDEPLTDYISPVGGGYFFVLPGMADKDDHLGRSLLAR